MVGSAAACTGGRRWPRRPDNVRTRATRIRGAIRGFRDRGDHRSGCRHYRAVWARISPITVSRRTNRAELYVSCRGVLRHDSEQSESPLHGGMPKVLSHVTRSLLLGCCLVALLAAPSAADPPGPNSGPIVIEDGNGPGDNAPPDDAPEEETDSEEEEGIFQWLKDLFKPPTNDIPDPSPAPPGGVPGPGDDGLPPGGDPKPPTENPHPPGGPDIKDPCFGLAQDALAALEFAQSGTHFSEEDRQRAISAATDAMIQYLTDCNPNPPVSS